MTKKVGMIFILLLMIIYETGCINYSTPSSMIKSPKVSEDHIKDTKDVKTLAQSFLDKGAKILPPNESNNKPSIYSSDLDGDKKEEVIVLFKVDETFEKGFFVLKNEDGKWNKVLQDKKEGIGISTVEFTSIYPNKKSILVGTMISGLAGSEYNAYTFNTDKFEKIDLGMWNDFNVLNSQYDKNNKGFVFSGAAKDTGNIKTFSVIRYDGKNFSYAEDFYESYYKNIVEYYKKILKENDKNQFAWYYLIDAKIKVNKLNEALNDINKVEKIKASGSNMLEILNHQFDLLKAKALHRLNRYSEAEKILKQLLNDVSKLVKKSTLENEGIKDFANMKIKNDLSNIHLELGKNYLSQNKKDEAKIEFNVALNLLEQISNEGYYGENAGLNISKNIDFNSVKNELSKIK